MLVEGMLTEEIETKLDRKYNKEINRQISYYNQSVDYNCT
jgi:hypothetical protein